jgi:hypothetical protein
MQKTPLLASLLLVAASKSLVAAPSLTIYNQNFAVVRDFVPLDLKAGVNRVQFPNTTAFLEPDSVVLRDPTGKMPLRILEQNYRADAASAERMLKLFEGQTIDFQVSRGDKTEIVRGKIIRSGTGINFGSNFNRGNDGTYMTPLIEVDGKLQFQLPGTPLFPSLGDGTILRPTLDWQLEALKPAKLEAELSYISARFNWEADYNVIANERGDTLNLTGWVTLSNSSGKTFENARIKLMAGDVNKIDPQRVDALASRSYFGGGGFAAGLPPVSEKTFDEYHLYTVERPTTLRDGETKQVEMVRAPAIPSKNIYIYDGVKIDTSRYGSGYRMENFRSDREYGTVSNPRVWVMREFANTKENGLGVPLPKGRVRYYRQNNDGQIEFTGENTLDHTPQGETVRSYTGDAFDLVGSRTRTNFETSGNTADESFEIKLRNRKSEPVEIRVVEHLYRWSTWEITKKSNAFVKTDAQTIEFRVQLKPDEEKVVSYSVHYSW